MKNLLKNLLDDVMTAFKGLIDIDRDGDIEITEIFSRVALVLPVLSAPAIDIIKQHIVALAGLGRVVDSSGGRWTPDQVGAAFDRFIAAADRLIERTDADSAKVREILGQKGQG